MKKLLLSTLCFASIAAVQAQCKIDYSNYHLILNEEFNTSITDISNRWFFDTGDPNWPGAGIEYYDPNQISLLPSGFLRLKATQVTPFVLTMPNGRTRTLKYKSGILRSKIAIDPGGWPGNDGIQYGIFEMRAKIPKGRTAYGTGEWDAWPAFWLTSGPTEIDIMDDIQPDPSRVWQMGMIDWTKYPNGNPTDWDLVCDCNTDPGNPLCSSPDFHPDIAYAASSTVKYDNKVYRCNKYVKKCSTAIFANKRGVDLSSDYFTYTGVWTPDKVTFFLNGTEVATISSSNIATTPFPTRIIANLEMMEGGSDPEYVMDIDYIRIWKPNNNNYALPYKSANEFMHHDISQSIGAPFASAMPNAIAVNPNNGNEIFYRDQNNAVCVAKRRLFSWPSWSVSRIPFNDGPAIPVAGDMRYLPQMNALIYVGSNNRINLFGRSTVEVSGFYHWYITSNYNCWWCVTDDYVSTEPGSLQTSDNGEIFFRGTDNKMHRYYAINGTWFHQILPTAYTNEELVSGNIVVESASNTVYYRGNDGRLQCFYKSGGNYIHAWIDDNWSTNAYTVSSVGGAMTFATGLNGVLYIGTDNKIHLFYWDVTWKHLLLPYTYSNPGLGYPNADLALNSLTWDKTEQRLYYNGFDGRIQCFGKTNGQWWHNWVDAYWNTDEFLSFNVTDQLWNGPKYASTAFGPTDIFYTRKDNHLAYFRYENCEILNPPTGYSPNAARPAPNAGQETADESAAAPIPYTKDPYLAGYAAAAQRRKAPRMAGDQLVISPNPSQDGIYHLSIYIPGSTGSYRLEVSDMLGNTIDSRNNATANCTIDLSRKPAGTYFIRIQSGSATLQGKLIKNR